MNYVTGRQCERYEPTHTKVIGPPELGVSVDFVGANSGIIQIYSDNSKAHLIAVAEGVGEFSEIVDADRFEYDRGARLRAGQIALAKMVNGKYCAIKVLDVKSSSHRDDRDEVLFDYAILTDGTKDFSVVPKLDVGGAGVAKTAILLGSGASIPFGGLSVSGVDDKILSHPKVRLSERLISLMNESDSYETALAKVRTGRYYEEDQDAFEAALATAFEEMELDLVKGMESQEFATYRHFLQSLTTQSGCNTGYIFSLNHDLLIERAMLSALQDGALVLPGISRPKWPATANWQVVDVARATLNNPPIDDANTGLAGQANLLKLHGSIDWNFPDKGIRMIAGKNKMTDLSNIPLLGWYHRIMDEVLNQGSMMLLIIGYGWGDEHINWLISEAVKKADLRLVIVDPIDAKGRLGGLGHQDLAKAITFQFHGGLGALLRRAAGAERLFAELGLPDFV